MSATQKTILFTGHRTLGNRGCEAIVRSTVAALAARLGPTRFLVPSTNIPRDTAQWPQASTHGVQFFPAWNPWYLRYWVNLQRLPFAFLKQTIWPFPIKRSIHELFASADAVISIGGDNYSLDYRIPTPIIALDSLAVRKGKPVFLWGASVGPFEKEPDVVATIKDHLSRFSTVFVRESCSLTYLKDTLELSNVKAMADPAFCLQPEETDLSSFWPEEQPNGVLGINVSPLVERYKRDGQRIRTEVARFIREAVQDHHYSVLFIPHVIPHGFQPKGNDHYYMTEIANELSDLGNTVRLAPPTLNAAQAKYVISRLRFFIGSRTHATIAALSSGIPTISIAYSVKARGINRDIFGHEDTVLPTPEVDKASLLNKLEFLKSAEDEMKELLMRLRLENESRVSDATDEVLSCIRRNERT